MADEIRQAEEAGDLSLVASDRKSLSDIGGQVFPSKTEGIAEDTLRS